MELGAPGVVIRLTVGSGCRFSVNVKTQDILGGNVKRMHRLGYEGRSTLRFDRIAQPWLREPTKRRIRLRLSRMLSLEAGGGRPVLAITRFARLLADVGIDGIEQIDRGMMQRYLANQHSKLSPQRQVGHIGLQNGFFAAIANTNGAQSYP